MVDWSTWEYRETYLGCDIYRLWMATYDAYYWGSPCIVGFYWKKGAVKRRICEGKGGEWTWNAARTDGTCSIVEEPEFYCDICGAGPFPSLFTLGQHMAAVHPPEPEPEFYCEICGAGPFPSLFTLGQHMAAVHPPELVHALGIDVSPKSGRMGDSFLFSGLLTLDGGPVPYETVDLVLEGVGVVGSGSTNIDGVYEIAWMADRAGALRFHSEALGSHSPWAEVAA